MWFKYQNRKALENIGDLENGASRQRLIWLSLWLGEWSTKNMGSRYSQPQAGFVDIIAVDQRFQIPFSETDTCISLDSLGWVTAGVLAGENFEGDRRRSWHPDWHWWTDTKPHFWALCKNFSRHRSFKESIWWNSCRERRLCFQSGGPIWAETVILPPLLPY